MAAGHAPRLWLLVLRDIPECVAVTVGKERNSSKCEEECESHENRSNKRVSCKRSARQSRRGQITRMYSRLLVYLHGVNLIGRYQLLTQCL